MPTALFLSPHLDDVAFSCGGTAARLSAAGWRCVVATAFTRSVPNPTGFALACQLDKGLPADTDYMAIRRAEDAAACAALGAEAEWLDFPEAPHRGYQSATELFAGVREEDRIDRPLATEVSRLWQELRPDAVFAPQGVGNHVDHVQLIEAVRESLPADAVTWYRDAPYVIRRPAVLSAGWLLAATGWPLTLASTDLAAKLDACSAYRTQLAFQFGGEAGMRKQLTAFAEAEGRAGGTAEPAERFAGRVPGLM